MIIELFLIMDLLRGTVGDTPISPPSVKPQKDYTEYPEKKEVGHMSFAEWEKTYGGSYLDYTDWVKGV